MSEDNPILKKLIAENARLQDEFNSMKDELDKAKNAARASGIAKSTLLANIIHEFRIPIKGILSYAGILKDRIEEVELNSMANSILNSSTRLISALDSIMYLSEIDPRSTNLNITKTDVSKSIAKVIVTYTQDFKEKVINCKTDLPEGVYANIDEILLAQVCKYLIENAIKSATSGIINIYVRESVIDLKKYAEIEINDLFNGIQTEQQELISQEFGQVNYRSTDDGSVLGLTLSRGITELMNGKISIENEPGKGTSYFVRFLLAEEISVEKNQNEVKSGLHEIKGIADSEIKKDIPDLLIVEDNMVNMELTVMFLKGVCRTDRAKDGMTAIKLASNKKYDVILMDINLGPGMNGLEATAEIRKLPGYLETPIVAVTGYTMSGDKEKMLQGGCTDYLAKPFDRKTIVGKVREVLNLA